MTGSVALGDYQQGRSDIDFMAFLSQPATDPGIAGLLADVHAGLACPADYDGNYVAMACVPDVPDDEPSVPHVVGGQFHADEPNHQLTPATWAEFARYGIAIRGPRPARLGVRVSRDRLSEWTLRNLNTGLFPAYRPALSSAVTWRATGHGDFTAGDWITCAELALRIVADANERYTRGTGA